MPTNIANISTLTRRIDDEVIRAMGVPVDGWLADRLHAILQRATRRFSELFAEVDRVVAEQGLPAGAGVLLRRLASGVQARGVENLPAEGPLIIASNHPGALDSVALITSAERLDLKVIASASPFLVALPNVSRHLIFAPKPIHVQERMLAVRESIRHLRAGGSLLLFAHGNIDPDPAFMPLTDNDFSAWSHSLEIFLRCVPEARVVIGLVSGVIDPGCMQHPLTWLRRARPDRQRLAMMIQIIQQMLGRTFDLTPRITFGPPLDAGQIGSPERALQVITDHARAQMQSHMAWQA